MPAHRRQTQFPADVTVSASWQLHYLLHQSAILLPFASSMQQQQQQQQQLAGRKVEEKGERNRGVRNGGKEWKMAAREASKRNKRGGNGFIKTIPVALVALDRNPVYRIMSVCPPMHVPVH
ncbi:hypothetical protein K0M31_003913, partial [Melipona bicolor]